MKPHGPIPPYFNTCGDRLCIGGIAIDALIAKAGGTPLFVYDAAIIRRKIAAVRAAMPAELGLNYAVKANPFPAVLAAIAPHVDGMDIASGNEMARARAAGAAAISFAGPGKSDDELQAAMRAGVVINLESAGEAARVLRFAKDLRLRPKLAVRINPDFGVRGTGLQMGGGPQPFGIDAGDVPDVVQMLLQADADWRGYHVYAGSQSLHAGAVADMQAAILELVTRLTDGIGVAPASVNLGGGFGVPYAAGQQPLDLDHIGARLSAALANRAACLTDTRFHIELGRYLVAEAGVYLTRIIDKKRSHGEVFLVVDGGLHHQLAACGQFGAVVRRNYPVAIASRWDDPPCETVHIVGRLCTPLDRLADSVCLPKAEVGDIVAIFLAGAYGATASPAAFLGHGPAIEMIVPDHFKQKDANWRFS